MTFKCPCCNRVFDDLDEFDEHLEKCMWKHQEKVMMKKCREVEEFV